MWYRFNPIRAEQLSVDALDSVICLVASQKSSVNVII